MQHTLSVYIVTSCSASTHRLRLRLLQLTRYTYLLTILITS